VREKGAISQSTEKKIRKRCQTFLKGVYENERDIFYINLTWTSEDKA